MKRELLLAAAVIALATRVLAGSGEKITEETAVEQVKKATGSLLDRALPSRAFGAWVNEKFDGWDVQWELHECGAGPHQYLGKRESANDSPVCVQVNIMQPSQKVHGDASDGFHVLFQVGTERSGLFPTPRVRLVTRKDGDEVERLKGLAQVEP